MGKYIRYHLRDCPKCGGRFNAKSNSKCWNEKGICSNCFKKSDGLICKICGNYGEHRSARCWKEGMCSKCFKKELHPRRFKHYTLCPVCQRRMSSLKYFKNGQPRKVGMMICVACTTIYHMDEKFKLKKFILTDINLMQQ